MKRIDAEQGFEAKLMTCIGCGKGFIYQTGEQYFYKSNWLFQPRRCPDCRAARRLTIGRPRGEQ